MLVSYIDKTKSGKKCYFSDYNAPYCESNKWRKIKKQVDVMYDHTNGRVDVADLL